MTNRPSQLQLEGFVEFVEQNPGIAKGILRTARGKIETKRRWEALAITVNVVGGTIKSGQGWAKYWAEKKCALKKHAAQASASMRRTGGGPPVNLPTLSALESRMVAVMGGQNFATGDPELSINPFPELNRPTEPPTATNADISVESSSYIPDYPYPGHSQDYNRPTTDPVPASSTPLPNNLPRPRRRRRLSVPIDPNMERFASIEARRVEAESSTAQALNKMAEAILCVSEALKEIARKMPEP